MEKLMTSSKTISRVEISFSTPFLMTCVDRDEMRDSFSTVRFARIS